MSNYNLCINTSENLSLKIPVMPLNKDIVNDNVDMHIVARNAIDESECIIDTIENFQTLPSEIINIEELTKQNDKFDKNISTELLPNESASNVTLPEYNLCINTSENLSLEMPDVPLNKDIVNDNVDTHTIVRNESTSNVMLPEYNLYKDILNQYEKKDTNNNSTSDNNFDRTVMFSFEELHDLDISLNNVLNHCSIDENNVVNNNLDKCCSNSDINISNNDNNIETENNNRDKVNNNSMDMAKLIHNTNSNLKLFRKTPSNVNDSPDNSDCNNDNSDCNSDNIDKDPNYCYSDSEDSNKENIFVQSCSTESNNITKSSLETSLNVSGQKICDDTNLHVKCSNLRGTGKPNFCYYCKKMQSKISRHLERVHKDEEEVKKFAALPKR